jgi:hypothetical protein
VLREHDRFGGGGEQIRTIVGTRFSCGWARGQRMVAGECASDGAKVLVAVFARIRGAFIAAPSIGVRSPTPIVLVEVGFMSRRE